MHFYAPGRDQKFPSWYFSTKRQFALGLDPMTGEKLDLFDDDNKRVNNPDWKWQSDDVNDGNYGVPVIDR